VNTKHHVRRNVFICILLNISSTFFLGITWAAHRCPRGEPAILLPLSGTNEDCGRLDRPSAPVKKELAEREYQTAPVSMPPVVMAS
jgi:hypothetical protein